MWPRLSQFTLLLNKEIYFYTPLIESDFFFNKILAWTQKQNDTKLLKFARLKANTSECIQFRIVRRKARKRSLYGEN